MSFQEFSKEDLVTYGNPYAQADKPLVPEVGPYDTQVLPPLDVVLAASTENQKRSVFRDVWISLKDRVSSLVEGARLIYSPKLREAERWEVANDYLFLTNVFLRHIPTGKRAGIVLRMIEDTRKPGMLSDSERRTYAKTYVSAGASSIEMSYPAWQIRPSPVFHEGIHYLQYAFLMRPNHALTHAVNQLQDILSGQQQLFKRRIVGGVDMPAILDESFDDKETWLDLVLSNQTEVAFTNDLQAKCYPDLRRYLENERMLDEHRFRNGELEKDQFGIKDPYLQSERVGTIRASRAAMLGWAAGDKDVAWTILWLHSLGYSFDDVERSFALAIKEGRTEQLKDYYLYPEVRVEDLGIKNPKARYPN